MSNTSDELDLGALLDRINGFFKGILKSLFKGLHFVLRNWIIILVLIGVGAALGYFTQKDAQPSQSANLVIRTNFNSAEYTYNALELLGLKSKEKDTIFLAKNGFETDTIEIKKVEILPVVSFKDIASNYEPNDRNLDALLRYMEFEENEEKLNSFNSDYKYHKVELTLSHTATNSTIDKMMRYLNDQKLIKEMARVGKQSILDEIERNNKTFAQIDTILDNYHVTQSLPSPNSQIFVVDKNFNTAQMLEIKTELQEKNKELMQELVYAEDAIINMNEESIFIEDEGILGNKILFYPFVLVFMFLFLAWMRHVYSYLKRVSEVE